MAAFMRAILVVPAVAGWVLAGSPAGAQQPTDRALVEAYNASGQQLFKMFAAARGNIVFSPYSIGTAMAMALSGARAETATEMRKVLRQRLTREDMDAANARVAAILNGYDKSAERPDCPGNMQWNGRQCEAAPSAEGSCMFPAQREGERCVAEPVRRPPSAQLRVANALAQSKGGDVVAKDYAALLKDKYGAELFQAADANAVNEWVKRKTEGRIERIIDQLPDVVLLNAMYFKARWQSTFAKEATQDKPFSLTRTQKVSVPMMARMGNYAVVARSNYRAIRLPYDVHELGMIIVLPNRVNGLPQIERRLSAQELAKTFAALRAANTRRVALEMPRFKTNFAADDLKARFRQAGLRRAFDQKRADFSGITGRPPADLPFWIDEIRHRAFIEVMEDGTEAAAVTAIAMRAAALPEREPDPEPFRVDRPFLFYIVDNATGAILFQGRIADPRPAK